MTNKNNRYRLLLVIPPGIGVVCFFLLAYFPNLFTVSCGVEKRPSVLLYILAPVLFGSVFVTIKTELTLSGVRKNSFIAKGFSFLFALSFVMTAVFMLFNAFILNFITTSEGIWPTVTFMFFGFAFMFSAFSIFGLIIFDTYMYVRRRTRAKKTQTHNKNSMVKGETNEQS